MSDPQNTNEGYFIPEIHPWIFGDEEPPLAELPTTARPGTLEKIEVMAQRLRNGRAARRPDDATWAGSIGAILRGGSKKSNTDGGSVLTRSYAAGQSTEKARTIFKKGNKIMATLNLDKIQNQVAALKAAGAPQIDPTGWEKLTTDLQHAMDEYKAAMADGKISLADALALAMDLFTLAGDIAALAGTVFQAKSQAG
jgi:hypothetical protein